MTGQIKIQKPQWTVVYDTRGGLFIGTGWEFFLTEDAAEARYRDLKESRRHSVSYRDDRYSVSYRPYRDEVDREHLGAPSKRAIDECYGPLGKEEDQ